MKYLIIVLSFASLIKCFGQKNGARENRIIRGIVKAEKNLRKFENKYEQEISNAKGNVNISYEDSIRKYNDFLASLLTNKSVCTLSDSDFRKITELTDIRILYSSNKLLKIVSWSVFNPYPTLMCSNLIIGKTITIISLNGTENMDIGDNSEIDSVVDIVVNNKPGYLLLGSSKCGNLCEKRTATIYALNDTGASKESDAFFDGHEHFSDIYFEYLINEEIKNDPAFVVEGSEVICPLFDEDKTRQIGFKRYQMVRPI